MADAATWVHGEWDPPEIILRRDALGDRWAALGPVWPLVADASATSLLMACRDHANRQYIVRLAVDDGQVVDEEVILSPGAPGLFDADGVGYPVLRRVAGGWELWYVGWRRLGGDVTFQNQVGMALLDDDLHLVDRHLAPWLPLTDGEPIGSGSLCLVEAQGREPQILYTSFLEWAPEGDGLLHRYTVHVVPLTAARAANRAGEIALALGDGEYALGHPTVVEWGEGLLCMFTARGDAYRLYAAVSDDGKRWARTAGPVMVPLADGCRVAQCYPRLVRGEDALTLYFSGDEYGVGALFRTRRFLPTTTA